MYCLYTVVRSLFLFAMSVYDIIFSMLFFLWADEVMLCMWSVKVK